MAEKTKEKKESERIINEEHTNHPMSNFADSLNQAQNGMPNIQGMGFRDIVGMILLLGGVFILYSVYKLFF